MLVMRPSCAADRDQVRELILARCAWLEERGLPSWRPSLDDLVEQCDNPGGEVWALEMDGRIVGRTTVLEGGSPIGWTDAERAEPALYLYTTVTAPSLRHMKLGTLIALWAVDRTARLGAAWVRRGCLASELARYYQSQGFVLVREVEYQTHRIHLLARRAELLDSDAGTQIPATRPAGS